MTESDLRRLLRGLQRGDTDLDETVRRLQRLPMTETPEATLDAHRGLRCGFPEVIYGEGKTVEQILSMATRLGPEALDALEAAHPRGHCVREARLFTLASGERLPAADSVAVVSAGTSDQPVAEEAAWTATALGVPVRRVRDVGVAGVHRVLAHQDLLRSVAAVVVVAGMEGALPSVVGGLTDRPVVAVPTSVGYGASLGGLAALLGMLNSCAAGVTVVNIDNGFGAGYAASLIARLAAASHDVAPRV
jgi:hypothetical protein